MAKKKTRKAGKNGKAGKRKQAAKAAPPPIAGGSQLLHAPAVVPAAVVPAAPAPAAPVPAPDPAAPPSAPPAVMPFHVFAVALLWMALLTAAFFLWINVEAFRELLPATLGPLPPETIWFGAVGGMLISFAGIYRYNRDWDPRFDYWHYTRPLLGAFMGVLGCLALIALTEVSTGGADVPANATFYSLVALVVGYREESFRTLISRVADNFLLPGRQADRPAAR